MPTILVSAKIHPAELSTDELHRLIDALNDELRRRNEVGESLWRVGQVRLVLRRLEANWTDQYTALEAAASSNGYISRSQALRLVRRESDANLNGFRKPFNTAAKRLAAEGHDMPDAQFPFWAEYNHGPGMATGFYIDDASLPVVQAALED